MSEVVVEMCDPRAHEAELKELFARNGKPGFDAAFNRAYRIRAAHGLRSWIGRIDGQPVAHVSVTPMRFGGAGQQRLGGVMGDLMVDEAHRDFWVPVRLLRKLVADVKRIGEIDFLVTTSVPDAESVFKAGGFKPLGTLHRYVMPLITPYLYFARLKSGQWRVRRPQVLQDADRTVPDVGASAPRWRPLTDAAFYDSRIPRSDWADLSWLSFNGDPAALVSRHATDPELRLVDAFGDDPHAFRHALHAAARWGRKQGLKKFASTTLKESAVAGELQRVGFLERDFRSTLLFQKMGAEPVPPVSDWFLLEFALSSW
jgi:GNAT superfamily N-acetyltransferase